MGASCALWGVEQLPWSPPASCQELPFPSCDSLTIVSLFFFLILFIYLFLAVLGLRFCARALSSCGKRGPLFIAVCGPLTIAASLVAERRLSSCGSRVQLVRGTWDLPRPGLEPVSPALAGRLSTTAPSGKPCVCVLTPAERRRGFLWPSGEERVKKATFQVGGGAWILASPCRVGEKMRTFDAKLKPRH